MEAARHVLETSRPELTSPLLKLMLEMTQALDGARLDEVQKVRKDRVGSAKKIVQTSKSLSTGSSTSVMASEKDLR
jgi:hypothetical protein